MLVDAAVHASGASKGEVCVPASAIFVDKTEKYDRQGRQKIQRAEKTSKKDRYTGKHFFSEN